MKKCAVKSWWVFVVICFLNAQGFAKEYTNAPTPPMGWNSWNRFGRNVSEELIMGIADAMVSSGMKDAGYQYVVIDDVWHQGRVNELISQNGKLIVSDRMVEGRDENGILIPDPKKFPHGMKYVADYVHSKGLKFGLYTVPGKRTCAGCTGSLGHEELDLKTFAEWGVDFIKLDGCGAKGGPKAILSKWRPLLDKLDRRIVLSINLGINDFNPQFADMWRTTGDIKPVWGYKSGERNRSCSITDVIDLQAGLESLHGNGGWNDPDMLQVGNGSLTDDENRAHFSIWCIFGAPLMAGNDLRSMSEAARQILINREALAVNQDAAGHMGRLIKNYKPRLQVWGKKLQQRGAVAVVLLNRTEQEAEITADFADLGIKGKAFIRDLWQHKDLGPFSKKFSATVPSHGVVMVKINADEPLGEFVSRPEIGDCTVLEPEDDEHVVQIGTVLHEPAGFTGAGYVKGGEDIAGIQSFRITLITPEAKKGTYRLEMRYINPGTNSLTYVVGGRGVQKEVRMELPPTGKPNDWQVASTQVMLPDGINQMTIRASDVKSSNLLIDHIKVISLGSL